MSNNPSQPFSNGSEYEFFRYNFCERCRNQKLRDDGFPEFPDKGGCPVLDATENARFDISQYPSEWIRELRSAENNTVLSWHYCIRFSNEDYENVMIPYFNLMKRSLVSMEEAKGEK